MPVNDMRHVLSLIGTLEIVTTLIKECASDTVDETLSKLVSKLRYDPAVYQFQQDYQTWIDKAPYDKIVEAPKMASYM